MMTFLTAAVVVCLVCLVLLAVLIVHLFIEVKAMQKSTHQVQFIKGADYEAITEDLKEKLAKMDSFDPI